MPGQLRNLASGSLRPLFFTSRNPSVPGRPQRRRCARPLSSQSSPTRPYTLTRRCFISSLSSSVQGRPQTMEDDGDHREDATSAHEAQAEEDAEEMKQRRVKVYSLVGEDWDDKGACAAPPLPPPRCAGSGLLCGVALRGAAGICMVSTVAGLPACRRNPHIDGSLCAPGTGHVCANTLLEDNTLLARCEDNGKATFPLRSSLPPPSLSLSSAVLPQQRTAVTMAGTLPRFGMLLWAIAQ